MFVRKTERNRLLILPLLSSQGLFSIAHGPGRLESDTVGESVYFQECNLI